MTQQAAQQPEKVEYLEACVRTGFDRVSPAIVIGAQVEYYMRCRAVFELYLTTYAGAQLAYEQEGCIPETGLFIFEVSHHSMKNGREGFIRWLTLRHPTVRASLEGCVDDGNPDNFRAQLLYTIDREAARELRDVRVQLYQRFYYALPLSMKGYFPANPFPA